MQQLEVFCDSLLVVEQLNGNYKIKNQNIKPLAEEAKLIMAGFPGGVLIGHIRRDLNKKADGLVNKALDDEGH